MSQGQNLFSADLPRRPRPPRKGKLQAVVRSLCSVLPSRRQSSRRVCQRHRIRAARVSLPTTDEDAASPESPPQQQPENHILSLLGPGATRLSSLQTIFPLAHADEALPEDGIIIIIDHASCLLLTASTCVLALTLARHPPTLAPLLLLRPRWTPRPLRRLQGRRIARRTRSRRPSVGRRTTPRPSVCDPRDLCPVRRRCPPIPPSIAPSPD